MDTELVLELERLYTIMSETKQQYLETDKHSTFAEMLYALTRGMSKERLLTMNDAEVLKHIQRIQIIEKK